MLRIDDIPQHVADDIHGFAVICAEGIELERQQRALRRAKVFPFS